MKSTPDGARVLVATDNLDDANQILRQLRSDFESVRSSTHPARSVTDFEEYRPDVLVLAFDNLDKAQRYYLGLYRSSGASKLYPHRTVILCTKDEVQAVFELCKKDYFDDYVLYWPQSHDGHRLVMSIWMACREITARSKESPQPGELLVHAKHLENLEKTLDREFVNGAKQIAVARNSLVEAEREMAGSLDNFTRQMVRGGPVGPVGEGNGKAMEDAVGQLRQQQVEQLRRVGADGIEPMEKWVGRLEREIKPAVGGIKALAEKVRKMRLVVMVVENDALTQQLITLALDAKVYEIQIVGDGQAALNLLRHRRPDVILTDIRLPGMNGLSLIQQLKASAYLADIPVIVMTGDARRETLMLSMESGAAAFLVKPFTRESLTSKLEKFLPR